jgi:hypothetical protein
MSMHLPRNGWDEQLPQMIKANVERLYKELDNNFALPVEIILMLERESQLIPLVRQYLHAMEDEQQMLAL